MNVKLDVRPDSAHSHLRSMMGGDGWRILVAQWNAERENIIKSGKSSRSEEKRVQKWAELDGFDRAVLMAERLLEHTKPVQEVRDEIGLPEEG